MADAARQAVLAASTLAPSRWCEAGFLLVAGLVAALQVLPDSLRGMLADYGVRLVHAAAAADPSSSSSRRKQQQSRLDGFVAVVTGVGRVPHAWFTHFYLLSSAASAFWAAQYLTRGSVMAALAGWEGEKGRGEGGGGAVVGQGDDDVLGREMGRVVVVWAMMALQGGRRLYESLFVTRPGSGSSMWIAHWLMGMGFYSLMSVSVWIERSDFILESWKTQVSPRILSPRVPLALAAYFWAWIRQHQCHAHLASLKKYTLPTAGLFRYFVCPHYTCECVIYLTIAFAAAPTGHWLSGPITCGLAFVVLNLAGTAVTTRRWYAQKFGAQAVASRWTMIPFVF